MHYTVEALLQGKEKVLEYFEKAKEKWTELFDKQKGADVKAWSEWIGEKSPSFEEDCGGRLMAPEIMAFSAFGYLYSIQFGWRDDERKMAGKLVKAIEAGGSSDEVKKAFKQAADFYALDESNKNESDKKSSSPEAA